MSLSKQLFIFMTLLFVMIFCLNFGLSVQNIKSYLADEAQGHAQDTAISLGLSLSPHIVNEADPILETMVKAIFDMGYYQQIKLVNLEGRNLVVVANNPAVVGVPAWFTQIFPMPLVTASSEVNAGWNPAATVYVTMHPGHATLKLYELVKQALYYSLLLLAVALVLLSVLLQLMLLPLKKINRLASNIADGHFATLAPLPWTQEVRNVAISMNSMSHKLGMLIGNAQIRLAVLNEQIQRDDLTGFKKKSRFESDLKQLLADNPQAVDLDAYVMVIRVAGLVELAKSQGGENIDHFLKAVAEKIRQITQRFDNDHTNLYRFVGSEFVLLLQQTDEVHVKQLAEALSAGFAEMAAQAQRLDIAHIGIAALDSLDTPTSILAAACEAVEQAQLIGANRHYLRQQQDLAKDAAAWKTLVFDIVGSHAYQVAFNSPMVSFKGAATLMEDAALQVYDHGQAILPVGKFIAIAEKFSKIVDLDRGVTQKVLTHINSKAVKHAIAVSLSTRTVKNPVFRNWLSETIGHKKIAQQVVFSFSAYAVAKDMAVYKEFFEFVHRLGAKVLLKRFEMQFLSLEMAHTLKVDYVRLPRDLSHNLTTDDSKRHFVATMQEVADLLDMPLLAENVQSDEDLSLIRNLGLVAASR